jgi:cell division transport system permease protein
VRPLSYFAGEAWRGFRQQRAVATNTILALVGALLVPAVYLVLLANALDSFQNVESRREMVLFLRDGTPPETVDSLRSRFTPSARSVVYVSKEEAWEEMSRDPVAGQLLEAVGGNPLPASLRVRLDPDRMTYAVMDSIAASLTHEESIEEVQFGGEAVRVLDEVLGTLRWVGLVVGVLIGAVVLIMVANTIRLTLVARRETHRVLLLLGADRGFVRLPLVLEGALACGLAAGIALALCYTIFLVLGPRLAVLPIFLPPEWMGAFVGVALLLGGFGGMVATVGLGTRPVER